MTPDVTFLAALLAGLVSFLSPCVLPLVPPYLVYLAGASLERLADVAVRARRETVLAALLFVAGFSTVFVALGASASVFGGAASAPSRTTWRSSPASPSSSWDCISSASSASACCIARSGWRSRKPVGLWGAYAMGLAFAFGWTPCIGPILAAILAVAASEATVARGAGLLAVYSLGLGIPFLLAAIAVEPFAAFLARFRQYLSTVERVMGGLLVLTGIAFLTGFVTTASFWLLEAFPVLGTIG